MISNFGQANLVSTEFELPTYLDLRFRLWEIQFGYVRVSDVSGNFVFRKKKQFGQSLIVHPGFQSVVNEESLNLLLSIRDCTCMVYVVHSILNSKF